MKKSRFSSSKFYSRLPFKTLLVLSLLIFFVSLPLAVADVPKLINLQGKLTDASKNPLTGTYNIISYLVFATAALSSIHKMNKLGGEILSGG